MAAAVEPVGLKANSSAKWSSGGGSLKAGKTLSTWLRVKVI